VIGKVGPDGIGKMVWTERKPLQNGPTLVPQSDDDFSGPQLGVQWEWNYQPRAEKWSLSARSGWLRLNAWKPLRPDNLKLAGNTLTQRVMRSARNVVTVELDPAGMADGQVAGLCHYNRNYGTIAIRREQGALFIETARNQAILRGPAINKNATLKLRSEWGLDGLCRFSYSMDGKTFTSLGEPYQFGWADYRGERIGLFSYNNAGDAGYADFRSFTYRYDSALTR
jgi:beta-xylosidase